LFIYVNAKSYQRAEVEEFVGYYLENIRDIVTAADYVPLPTKIYEMAKKTLDEETFGTRFLTEDGTAREGTLEEIYSGPVVTKLK
jgi:phosphate transport system substrate-binding protein